jgi:hypothetical protein
MPNSRKEGVSAPHNNEGATAAAAASDVNNQSLVFPPLNYSRSYFTQWLLQVTAATNQIVSKLYTEILALIAVDEL